MEAKAEKCACKTFKLVLYLPGFWREGIKYCYRTGAARPGVYEKSQHLISICWFGASGHTIVYSLDKGGPPFAPHGESSRAS